ncbi:hypothetical protein HDU97_002967 [Phlyctochytrium planicorne]|nr:hypothetical protein HDU97_002967 [Phlyctochytrium planicorne]
MCYVKTSTLTPAVLARSNAKDAAGAVAAPPAAAGAVIESKEPFSFQDFSLDSFADTNWLNMDNDAMFQSALASTSIDTTSSISNTNDFMPWLDSILNDNNLAATSANDMLFASALDSPISPLCGGDDLIKQEASPLALAPSSFSAFNSPYLPSPADSAAAEQSAFPSLCSRLSSTTSSTASVPVSKASTSPVPVVMSRSGGMGGAPASPPASSSSGDESSNAAPAKNPRKRAAPSSRKSTSNNNGRKKASSNDDEDDDDEHVDDAALKRLKNTEAARRSRARKVQKLETLEMEVASLEKDKAALQVRLAVLENEQASFAQREADLGSRILQLEAQLAESHRAMILSLQR